MAPLLSSSIDLMLFYAPAARSDARCGRQLRLRKSAVRSAADLCTRRRHCADSDVQLKAAKMHIRTYFTPTASKTGENDHWYVMWVHCKQTLINHVCAWTILSIRCKNSQYCPLDGHYVGSSRLSNESGMMPSGVVLISNPERQQESQPECIPPPPVRFRGPMDAVPKPPLSPPKPKVKPLSPLDKSASSATPTLLARTSIPIPRSPKGSFNSSWDGEQEKQLESTDVKNNL